MKQGFYQYRQSSQETTQIQTVYQSSKKGTSTNPTIEPEIHYPAPDLDNPANQQHERIIIGFTSTGKIKASNSIRIRPTIQTWHKKFEVPASLVPTGTNVPGVTSNPIPTVINPIGKNICKITTSTRHTKNNFHRNSRPHKQRTRKHICHQHHFNRQKSGKS
jgi:hypothetical protein